MTNRKPPIPAHHAVSMRPLLHERDAAKLLGVSPAWLQRARWAGTGPDYVKAPGKAGSVRYTYEDLCRWIDEHRKTPSARADVEGK